MHQYCWRWRRSFYSFFFIYVRIHFKNEPNCKQTRVVRISTFNTQVTQFSWMLTRKIITLHMFGTASDLKWKNMFVSNRVRTKNIFQSTVCLIYERNIPPLELFISVTRRVVPESHAHSNYRCLFTWFIWAMFKMREKYIN